MPSLNNISLKGSVIKLLDHSSALISDKLYLKQKHYRRFKKWPKCNSPQTFNEHLLVYKLKIKNNFFYSSLADKIDVKEYVKAKVGEEYVIPTLWQGNDPNEIPFESLNPPYVVKAAHGWSQTIFVHETPTQSSKKTIIREAQTWLRLAHGRSTGEFHYESIPKRILIEPNISDEKGAPDDYKFFIFNGQLKIIQYVSGRFGVIKTSFHDVDWNLYNFTRVGKAIPDDLPKCPENLPEMIEIAKKIASGLEFARIDLYNICGNVLFGEITLTPAAGYGQFSPAYADRVVGDFWTNSLKDNIKR